MSITVISFEDADKLLDWSKLTDAMIAGHALPKAQIKDTFLYRDKDTMLSRAAWIDGLGLAVKTATVFPENAAAGHPTIHGAVSLFSDEIGSLDAIIDFKLVTKWKTAADSLLAAKKLARPESNTILIVGGGQVAGTMIDAYRSHFPNAAISVWSRTAETAKTLAARKNCDFVTDLKAAVERADIICTCTMSTEPVVKGAWLRPGQHLDLIGAYRPDMREVDDLALQKAELFVDSFETTVDHIGELRIPLEAGTISRADIHADFYALDQLKRSSDDVITICKNGGGAHLDLMTSRYILDAYLAT